jgi:hypothetical protein
MTCSQNVPTRKMVVVSNVLSWDSTVTLGMPPFLTYTKHVLPDFYYFISPFRTPCGFCFVEFYTHAEALASMRYVSGTKLDERIIRCDLDLGYREGRQFGRGKSGGQVCSNSCFLSHIH